MSAEGGGLVLDGVSIQEVEGEVAQGRQDHGVRPGANATVVLAEGHVADIEDAVLDPPMLSGQAEQRLGIGDYDCDQIVDLLDFSAWEQCMTGPSVPDPNPQPPNPCQSFDFDGDDDIDLLDFAAFQAVFPVP